MCCVWCMHILPPLNQPAHLVSSPSLAIVFIDVHVGLVVNAFIETWGIWCTIMPTALSLQNSATTLFNAFGHGTSNNCWPTKARVSMHLPNPAGYSRIERPNRLYLLLLYEAFDLGKHVWRLREATDQEEILEKLVYVSRKRYCNTIAGIRC